MATPKDRDLLCIGARALRRVTARTPGTIGRNSLATH